MKIKRLSVAFHTSKIGQIKTTLWKQMLYKLSYQLHLKKINFEITLMVTVSVAAEIGKFESSKAYFQRNSNFRFYNQFSVSHL
jgi:hypothetical protein